MTIKVGIPRGLTYYYYGKVWSNFFQRLGAQAVISGETTQATVERGGVIDEVCLPVKVCVGHIAELADKADYIFLPRIVSMAAGQYSCPKLIGLPDMVRSNIPHLPPLIDVTVNMRSGRRGLYDAVVATGRVLEKNALASIYAWQRAWWAESAVNADGFPEGARPRVAVIGHPYIIYDRQVSMDVLGKLAALGVSVVTTDMVDPRVGDDVAHRLPKRLFWQYCHQLVGSALAIVYSPQPLDGTVFVTSFACGPDSLIGEVLKWHASQMDIPFMLLTLDEHSAEAGLLTRLEAFVDMLGRREDR